VGQDGFADGRSCLDWSSSPPVTSSLLAGFQGSVFVAHELQFDPGSALRARIWRAIEVAKSVPVAGDGFALLHFAPTVSGEWAGGMIRSADQ
jgi:hypothetical protein